MNRVSDKYDMIQFLYNINSLKNLNSIFRLGLLSKNEIRDRGLLNSVVDLSNPEVQNLRDNKRVPNHGELHDYANLYIDARNPMMYYEVLHKDINYLCVICVDKRVLDLKETVVTDKNAATELAKEKVEQLNLGVPVEIDRYMFLDRKEHNYANY